ncbi:MAG: molybdopterin-guanine dinucleotide biosynthesis protein B [Collinsella tanakaei]
MWEREGASAAAVEGKDGADAAASDSSEDAPAAPAPAVAFIGYQNSGKTTLVEKVIAELTARGLRVGSIKHHGHHRFDIDVPGKDSWRHAEAGSRHVGLICANRYAEYADTDQEFPLDGLLARYTDVDVVIVEGYKTAGLPNVVVARSGVDRLRGSSSLDLVDDATLAIACNDTLANHIHINLPVADINDAATVANVVEGYLVR